MVELTDRERYIIATMFYMMNPMMSKFPKKTLGKALHLTILIAYDKEFTGNELQDLVDGVRAEKDAIMATTLQKINQILPNL